jgi:hypothetical protein
LAGRPQERSCPGLALGNAANSTISPRRDADNGQGCRARLYLLLERKDLAPHGSMSGSKPALIARERASDMGHTETQRSADGQRPARDRFPALVWWRHNRPA